jgi:hypothetical protein
MIGFKTRWTDMGHTLVLELPEEVFEPLAKTADQSGKSPEEIAVRLLVAAVQSSDDPVEKFIGALSSSVGDWADQHDKYVGADLLNGVRAE